MGFFNRQSVHFTRHNPLDNGLADEIANEQNEAESFLHDMSGEDLTKHWNAIVKDIEKDPDWFSFSED